MASERGHPTGGRRRKYKSPAGAPADALEPPQPSQDLKRDGPSGLNFYHSKVREGNGHR